MRTITVTDDQAKILQQFLEDEIEYFQERAPAEFVITATQVKAHVRILEDLHDQLTMPLPNHQRMTAQ